MIVVKTNQTINNNNNNNNDHDHDFFDIHSQCYPILMKGAVRICVNIN